MLWVFDSDPVSQHSCRTKAHVCSLTLPYNLQCRSSFSVQLVQMPWNNFWFIFWEFSGGISGCFLLGMEMIKLNLLSKCVIKVHWFMSEPIRGVFLEGRGILHILLGKLTCPWKSKVGTCISYWNMFGGVHIEICGKNTWALDMWCAGSMLVHVAVVRSLSMAADLSEKETR